MKPPLFAELCCGSAAVTLALLGGLPARPPVSYMGSKRGYAAAILAAMGLRPGQGADAVLLCDPGPWSQVWSVLSTPEGCREVAATIRGWVDEEPRALWERLRAGRPLEGETTPGEVAAWLAMTRRTMWCNQGSFYPNFAPATPKHDRVSHYQPDAPAPEVEALAGMRWPPAAFVRDGRIDPAEVAAWLVVRAWSGARLGAWMGPTRPSSVHPEGWTASITAPGIVRRVESTAEVEWPPLAIAGDATRVDPPQLPEGSIVYIDPPYQGTTGYAHDLPRADVLAMALRWQAAGALVVVSEAEPLPLPGWHHIEITGERVGQRRSFSKQQSEWLTMSQPPAVRFGGQSSLFGAP